MLHDADIRDGLCFYLEERYGEVRFFEELTIGKSRADIVMVTRESIIGIEIKSDADIVKDYLRKQGLSDSEIVFSYSADGQTKGIALTIFGFAALAIYIVYFKLENDI